LQLYVVAVVGLAVLADGVTYLLAPPAWSGGMLLLAGLISLCVVVSHRLPVKPAPKRILVLNGSLLMVAIVALPPAVAVLSAVLGVAAGNAYLRRPWFNLLFNTGK